MKRIACASLALAASIIAPAANAQLFRAYLASTGNDGNPCTVALPCRLLPAALAAVTAGGDVWMMDSANFNSGTVTISKDVTIVATPGQVGSILAINGTAAMATSGPVTVALRNVVISDDALLPGTDGIDIGTGGTVMLTDSTVHIPSNIGVNLQGGGTFVADNVTFRGGGSGGASQAIVAAGTASVNVSNSRFFNMLRGLFVLNGAASTTSSFGVTSSMFSHVAIGVYAWSTTAGANIKGTVSGSTFMDGSHGIGVRSDAGASSVVTAAANTITGMVYDGLLNVGATGSVMETLSSNVLRNNPTSISGSYTPVSAQ